MKKTIILSMIISSQLGFSQNEEESIKEIRSWFKMIESNLDNYEKHEVKDYVDQEMYDGNYHELTGYYDSESNSFVKIVDYSGGDWNERWDAYYFHNGEFFFNFISGYSAHEYYTAEELEMGEEEYYESGMEAKSIEAYERRLYFADGLCIRNLVKTKVIKADAERDLSDVEHEWEEPRAEEFSFYVGYTAKMIDALKKKMDE